jgi:hypothetical protein
MGSLAPAAVSVGSRGPALFVDLSVPEAREPWSVSCDKDQQVVLSATGVQVKD